MPARARVRVVPPRGRDRTWETHVSDTDSIPAPPHGTLPRRGRLPPGGRSSRIRPPRLFVAALAGLALVVAACGGAATAVPSSPTTPSAEPGASETPTAAPTATPAADPVALKVGLGYIPSVQFAQFYLADQAGYYRDAGLEVTFENKIDPDLVTLVGQGGVDVGIADGTSVIPAVSQGIPIRYVFTVYADFPSIVFAKASSGIAEPADLAGRKIGIPGRYGSSWIQLQALLAGVGLTPEDVDIVPFPDFGQLAALEQGVVDAATGFVNNEPIRLELAGTPAVVLALPDDAQLPGNGLIVGQAILDGPKAEAVRAFIAATRRAMEEIRDGPRGGPRGRDRPDPRAGGRPRGAARRAGGDDRDVAERLHGGQRVRGRRPGRLAALDRLHEQAAGLAGRRAGDDRGRDRRRVRGRVADRRRRRQPPAREGGLSGYAISGPRRRPASSAAGRRRG